MRGSWKLGLLAAAGMSLLAASAEAQTLRIGLQEDPDLLDPDRARTFVGRIVFAGLCDKLFDIDKDLQIVPQLATEWSWDESNTALSLQIREGVVFHDGEPLDAEAVKYNLERSLNLPGSTRRSEIVAVTGIEVTGEHSLTLQLERPFAPLLAALSDRAGMMVSPAAAEAAGDDFALNPVCSGPFRFVEREAQDRIVLERFEDYWDADAIHLDRVVYRPIPDTTVRLANLQAGDLDMIERTAATDLEDVREDANLELAIATSLGYQGITVNIGNGPRAENPLGQDPRVREALELALDRNIVNQVAFDGAHTPGNQPVAPSNPFYAASVPLPERNLERAQALLAEAGHESVTVELMAPNNPDQLRVAQIVQALAAEAGFQIEIVATEFATALDRQTAGDFEAFLIGWSGRADPDGNIHIFTACQGGLNDGKYCNEEVDRLLTEARSTNDSTARRTAYDEAAQIYLAERPRIYLYHVNWFWSFRNVLEGFEAHPDGMIRLQGLRLGS